MDRHRLENYKKRLLREREDLIGLVTRTEHDGRKVDEEGTKDPADKAANAYTKEFLFHQSSKERRALQMIEDALERVGAGTFGRCLLCGKPMEQKRLDAVPWAQHCIACQKVQDNGSE